MRSIKIHFPAKKWLGFFPFAILLFLEPAKAQLNAGFSVNKTGGCSPLIVAFTNTTTGAGPNATYLWDFGNGNTSTLPNPGALFTDVQAYTVTLTVTMARIPPPKAAR